MALSPTARVRGSFLEPSTVNAVLLKVISETTTGLDPELLSVTLLLPEFPTLTDPNSMLAGETLNPLPDFVPSVDGSKDLTLPQPARPAVMARAASNKGNGEAD